MENEIAELRNNGTIDETFKITNPIDKVLNFPEHDFDITSENFDISCLNTQSSHADEENDAILSLNNNNLTPTPQTVFREIQNTQFNVRSNINTDVTDNHSNNHGVNTNTKDKTNIQTISYTQNDKTPVHRDNDDSNLIKRQSTNSSKVRKEVFIIGHSMIKYVNGREVSRNNSLKAKSHPGVTTDDFIDYVRSTVHKKPNLIIIHTGTNDIHNNVNTIHKIRKAISSIKEYDADDNINFALSSIIH